MAGTGDAVLIGFIITVTLIGIGGGVSLGVFICVKWRECLKRNRIPVAPSRQPTRRNRRIRVHNATPQQTRRNSAIPTMEPPPPYSEIEADLPPPYSLGNFNLNQARQGSSRGNTRGSSGIGTPFARTRNNNSVARNSLFSVHLNTGSTNTPMITPSGSMFASSTINARGLSASNARGLSASNNGRQGHENIEDGIT